MRTNSPRRIFFDTNILIYEVDRADPIKQTLAENLLRNAFALTRPVISAQVLSEYVSITTTKLKPALPLGAVQSKVVILGQYCDIVPVNAATVVGALQTMSKRSLSWWDALIHASAVAAGVTDVLSEDLVHLRTLEGISYHNPFNPGFDIQTLLTP